MFALKSQTVSILSIVDNLASLSQLFTSANVV